MEEGGLGCCFECKSRGRSAKQCRLPLGPAQGPGPGASSNTDASYLTLRIAAGEAALIAFERHADDVTYNVCMYQLSLVQTWMKIPAEREVFRHLEEGLLIVREGWSSIDGER